jgi:hypothetical protein
LLQNELVEHVSGCVCVRQDCIFLQIWYEFF